MLTFIRIFLCAICLYVVSSASETNSVFDSLTITTAPASLPGLPQHDFVPRVYAHKQLENSGQGYYSLEGTVNVDSSFKDPALYIGSTPYPIDVYLGGELLYRWGNGKDSRQFVDYRSHGVGINPKLRGKQTFRVDFWCNGEEFAMPAFYFGERTDVVNRSTLVSLFNLHLLNGILVAAVFISLLFGGTYVVCGMKDKDILYFALFSLTLVFSLLIFPLNSQQFEEIPLFKLGRICTLFLPFWMLQFVRSYTIILDRSKLLFWIPLCITLSISLLLLFEDGGKTGINQIFNCLGISTMIAEFLIVLGILIRSYLSRKKIEVALIFIGFFAFIIMVIHDLFYLSISMFPLFWWISYGYLFVTISMLGALMIRQRKAYDDLLYYRIELLEANHRIELESSSRESFIQTIAHELRTPLHGMDTGLRALADRIGTEKVDQLISSGVFTSFHRLKITLQNIFGYVAAENRTLRIVSHRFNLKSMIEELRVHFKTLSEEKGVSFSINFSSPTMPENYRGDRDHIQLAMANIMLNAVKYTETGGVCCDFNYHNGKLTCSITDTGCGIKEELRVAFVGAFHRNSDLPFSERYEGVGLGLSITDSIVKAMGGDVSIESICDRGTSVILTIPLSPDFVSDESLLSDYTILVVDDNRVNCQLLSMMVEKLGCSTALAFNGEEAVRLHKKHRYDLILMDIQMPVMDGFAATTAIRKFNTVTPIVAVTANADYLACLNVGMNDHLSKPVNYDHLKEIMVRLLH